MPVWFTKNPLALGLDLFKMSENEYRELVLAAFDRAFKANRLSQELVLPTAGTLKAEAIKVCSKRFDPNDETVLGSFIKSEPGAASYLRAIQNCDYQLFRPLSTFLNDRTRGTTFRNIQLLAWLIDFKPRPFHPALVIPAAGAADPEPIISIPTGNDEENDSVDNIPPLPGHDMNTSTEIKDEENGVLIAPSVDSKKKPGGQGEKSDKTIDKRWLIGIAAMLIGGVLIWRFLPTSHNCMYWDNDHYIATSCNVPRTDTPLVRLDPAKLRGFRRLHHVDTLTYYSVDKLWYVRVGGIIEVYSAYGKHPLYPDKKLAPLTYYAVNVCQKQHGY
ncbi:MAG: hypothetical protein WC615_01655 [Mucilaginibacter sp.]|jgi:hypothetical protein|uniref:hypothetical protein n=1 Tax=Mucilaginibacter sp. TaxID=1882438 RepID=UPI003563C745